MAEVPVVLFVCVHNAGRSQMAAALLERHADGRVDVRSAGSTPADEVNPAVVAVMDELEIDLRGVEPTLLTNDAVETADVVITMGCGDTCRCSRASGISIGTCRTPPVCRRRPCDRSAIASPNWSPDSSRS